MCAGRPSLKKNFFTVVTAVDISLSEAKGQLPGLAYSRVQKPGDPFSITASGLAPDTMVWSSRVYKVFGSVYST